MTVELLLILLLAVLLSWVILLWKWRHTIYGCWHEPVLRRQVLIIESDDWGPGPDWHAERLASLRQRMARYVDADGRPALMTLGIVLSVPDTAKLATNGLAEYQRLTLKHDRCSRLLQQMKAGMLEHVFALQLHGMEHFWPGALLEEARHNNSVREWLTSEQFPKQALLPSSLQSRWIDGSYQPSQPLSKRDIQRAVAEEIGAWEHVFGSTPKVAVPPTFVWTQEVEAAWISKGIEVVVTPGRRFTHRDTNGQPAADAPGRIYNGQKVGESAQYLVRDIYYEPERGHTEEQALNAANERFLLGRPALLETHQSNFIGSDSEFEQHLGSLERLLSIALERWPALAFISPKQLADVYLERKNSWVATGLQTRLHFMLRRLGAESRLRKLAYLTGIAAPAALALMLTAPAMKRSGEVD
ncbi:MAG: glycosyl hydrolase [Pseudomonadota bacterium]